MKCLRLLTLLPLCALISACLTGQQDPPFTLTLAHMNDTHSQFDPVNAELKGALFGNQGEIDTLYTRLGGYPRLLTMTKAYQAEALAKNQPLLLLHGGDAWQGSGYFKLNEGLANAELLSQFGLDANLDF